MKKENFHTHTLYCDGKNTPEEMIISAIDKNFTALGFSGHSLIRNFDCDWCMSEENTEKYINELKLLKNKYKDSIDIYCGTELDYYSTDVPGDYDFSIGSVHYIEKEGEYLSVDCSLKEQQKAADRYYGGSLIDYAVDYFRITGDVLAHTDADIVGHFDLVSKFNENDIAFDTSDKKYIKAWQDAVDRLIPFNKPFEINTGAISRGYRKTPYPALDIAEYINGNGGFFILTSDCHNKDYLDCFFEDALKLYGKYNIVNFSEILKK